ncbi:hypothetical protein B0J12DRAFT_242508 [Macrophomina phaseolina]|uniref:Transmembrane protein n=1 Tax=Macrophomina phaseolina TaxID=35725 RepID=A0ABQ8GR53_9PEZI|nr:hypothetical protein B0J12DRAFT_242508 [Macrophomina phaseolina]
MTKSSLSFFDHKNPDAFLIPITMRTSEKKYMHPSRTPLLCSLCLALAACGIWISSVTNKKKKKRQQNSLASPTVASRMQIERKKKTKKPYSPILLYDASLLFLFSFTTPSPAASHDYPT